MGGSVVSYGSFNSEGARIVTTKTILIWNEDGINQLKIAEKIGNRQG
jgi:hypothetical protein